MKNILKTKRVSRFLSLIAILSIIFSSNISTLAAEANINNQASTVDMQSTYGSLSGYGYKYDTDNGSFTFNVNGSWSPYAGCTIKTEGFSSSSQITVKVYDSNGACKTTQTLGPNVEKANIAILNVPTGTYTVRYSMLNPSGGSIQVWIY